MKRYYLYYIDIVGQHVLIDTDALTYSIKNRDGNSFFGRYDVRNSVYWDEGKLNVGSDIFRGDTKFTYLCEGDSLEDIVEKYPEEFI